MEQAMKLHVSIDNSTAMQSSNQTFVSLTACDNLPLNKLVHYRITYTLSLRVYTMHSNTKNEKFTSHDTLIQ